MKPDFFERTGKNLSHLNIGHGQSTQWLGPPDTPLSWFDTENWSNGVPLVNLDAIVDNGGTVVLSNFNAPVKRLWVGRGLSGTVRQESGTLAIANERFNIVGLGQNSGSIGRYELVGGDLNSKAGVEVGIAGTGVFVQTGGIVTTDRCILGLEEGGVGTYELDGGELVAARLRIGEIGGAGHFIQRGGIVNLGTAGVGDPFVGGSIVEVPEGEPPAARYTMTGGEIQFSSGGAPILRLGFAGAMLFEMQGGFIDVNEFYVSDRDRSGDTRLAMSGGRITGAVLLIGDRQGPDPAVGRFDLSGGEVRYERVYMGTGSCEHSGGDIEADMIQIGDRSGAATWNMTGGQIVTQQILVTEPGGIRIPFASLSIESGVVRTGELRVADSFGSAPGGLHLPRGTNPREVTISELLFWGGDFEFTAGPGALISMRGASFENRSRFPDQAPGSNRTTLAFSGREESTEATFEIGGLDVGQTEGGFVNNFAFESIMVGTPTDTILLTLEDSFVNRDMSEDPPEDPLASEALYLCRFVVGPGSTQRRTRRSSTGSPTVWSTCRMACRR